MGFAIVAINILLVAGLVLATSAGELLGLKGGGETPTETPPAGTSPSTTLAPPTSRPTTNDPVAQLKERFDDGDSLNVVVLGDQTGTHQNDWVGAWVRDLAGVRPVEFRAPTSIDPTRYADPVKVGTEEPGPGQRLISVRNASIVGATPRYAAPRVHLFVPQDTDVVVLNYGRSNTPDDIKTHLDELHTALTEEIPQVQIRVVIQPPRQDRQPPLDSEVRDWATAADLPIIDVAAVFTHERLLTETVSTRDPLSVNIMGGRIWARIVQGELFGSLDGEGTPTDPVEVTAEPRPSATIPEQPVVTIPPPASHTTRPIPPLAPTAPPPPTTTSPPPLPPITTSPPPPPPTTSDPVDPDPPDVTEPPITEPGEPELPSPGEDGDS